MTHVVLPLLTATGVLIIFLVASIVFAAASCFFLNLMTVVKMKHIYFGVKWTLRCRVCERQPPHVDAVLWCRGSTVLRSCSASHSLPPASPLLQYSLRSSTCLSSHSMEAACCFSSGLDRRATVLLRFP